MGASLGAAGVTHCTQEGSCGAAEVRTQHQTNPGVVVVTLKQSALREVCSQGCSALKITHPKGLHLPPQLNSFCSIL